MASPAALDRGLDSVEWRPRALDWLAAALAAADRLFDRIYGSRYNPLHRTGPLAALLLTVALVTGVYLIFVYEIGRPHESIRAIQGDVLVGRWVRALHRYASDAAVIAVVLHVLRMLVHGKTWGARLLAWITGVLLAGMMAVSAFTGFVLVWDVFGLKLATIGARMLRLLPLFVEPPDRSFVGDRPMPSAFFFMNLFLHVAVPLGMICFLWLHTSRLARAAWFPEKRVVAATLVGLLALAVAWPAPLPRAADLLGLPGRAASDWFYGFWIPVAHAWPEIGLAVTVGATALLLGVPSFVRPGRRRRAAPAASDPDHCEGCRQCLLDCPFDAIQMVTGKFPDKHPLRAEVLADACVSCGLCAGSCASLAIGPPGRTAIEQLAVARGLVAATPDARRTLLLLACRHNRGLAERARAWCTARSSATCVETGCSGTLHPGTLSYLATRFAAVKVLACPPGRCLHREGATLADARILGERRPAIPGRLTGGRVPVAHYSAGEWPRIAAEVLGVPAETAERPDRGRSLIRGLLASAFTAALLALVALGSGWPQGVEARHSVLRLGWRLPAQTRQSCRDLSSEEIRRRPVRMRVERECSSEALVYDLEAAVDGRVIVRKRMRPAGLRADRPMVVEEDLAVEPGEHRVVVTFAPVDRESGAKVFTLNRRLGLDPARVVLVTIREDGLDVLR